MNASKEPKIGKAYVLIGNNHKQPEKTTAALIDPKETYCVEIKTAKKTSRQIAAAKGCKPTITPNEVATPFPPLNPANTGNTCPNTAIKEATS